MQGIVVTGEYYPLLLLLLLGLLMIGFIGSQYSTAQVATGNVRGDDVPKANLASASQSSGCFCCEAVLLDVPIWA